MEAKRTAEEVEDSITVAARDAMRKRQAREVSYPQASGRSETPEDEEMIVEVSPEPAGKAQNSPEPQDDENDCQSEEEEPQPKKTRKARKTGVHQGRKVPIKLPAEAQPGRMVDKILDQPIDRITVRELLGLLPDLLREIWGIRRLPPLNKTTIPSTQAADIGFGATVATTSAKGLADLQGVRVVVHTIRGLKELYACASPTVMGIIGGKLKVKMLINSGSEMCVMSRDLYERVKGLLPVDTEIRWSIGSANSTMDMVFGVCHSMAVEVGGIEIPLPVFILEGASQEFILGRTWDRLAHAQHDNRQDGSLYISITSLDNRKKATFCAVADRTDCDRDRVRILRLEDEARGETSLGAGLGNSRANSGDAGRCSVVRMIEAYEYGEYCEEKMATNRLIGGGFTADGGFSALALAVEAMGQPIFWGGEGAKELIRRMRRVWRARLEEKVRTRISGVGRVRTLYKRKAVKVVPVDEAHSAGIKPSGEEGWRERLIKEEKERGLDGGAYPGELIPKFLTIEQGRRLTQARIRKLDIGEHLTTNERDLLHEMLFNREAAIAFDSAEKGRFHNFIESPHVIPTVPHKAWQAASFRIPLGLHETRMRLIQDRLACGTFERSFGPYRNPWLLVEKPGFEKDEEGELVLDSAGKPFKRYRLINSAQKINAVSIRDPSLPPAVEEFSERFAGYPVVSLVDLFSGYDQCTLDPASRDITAYHTPLGLMRMTTLPMG